MCLYEYRISAIAPTSENLFVTDVQYQKLKKHFNKIFLLYDNDLPGINAAVKIHKQYPDLQVLIIPAGAVTWKVIKEKFSNYRNCLKKIL